MPSGCVNVNDQQNLEELEAAAACYPKVLCTSSREARSVVGVVMVEDSRMRESVVDDVEDGF